MKCSECQHENPDSTKFCNECGYALRKVEDIPSERFTTPQSYTPKFQEWERTFDAVSDLVAILDNNHRIVRVNKAMADRLGVTPDEEVGLTCYEHVHGAEEPPPFCPHARLLADGQEHSAEVHEKRLGGDFLVTVSPIHDNKGRLAGSVHVARDITERKKAEEALQESEERYKHLVEDAQDIIYKINLKGYFTFFNYSAIKVTGYSEQDLLIKHYLDLVRPDYHKDIERHYISQFEKTIPSTYFEFPMITRDGKEVWLGQNFQLLKEDERIVGFQAVARDITKRKQTEEALQESQGRLETILHSMPVGIIIIDPETHKIVDVNPKAMLMIGAPLEQITGSQCHNFICPAEKGKCPITDFGQTIDNSERVLLDVNGESVPILKTVIPLEIDDRKFLVECFVDISEHKRVEQERIEKEKLQGVIEMAGAVCHELNQPMQAISGYSELLMMEIKDDNLLYDKIKKIKKQVDRMGTITQKLMRITKYETKDYLKGKIIDIDKAMK